MGVSGYEAISIAYASPLGRFVDRVCQLSTKDQQAVTLCGKEVVHPIQVFAFGYAQAIVQNSEMG